MYFDTHVHLAHNKFDKDCAFVIKTSWPAIRGMIEVSYTPEMWPVSKEIAQNSRNIRLACGIHPHDADRYRNFGTESLESLHAAYPLVAIGEIGLDYFRDYAHPENQKAVFIRQLELAKKLNLPAIFHVRSAFDDFFEITKNYDLRGVVHSFSGNMDEVTRALDKGFYIGLNCIFMYVADKEEFSEIINYIPLDRILFETDSPFLPPLNMRSKRNIPQNITYVAEYVSGIKNIRLEAMNEKVLDNVSKLFAITPLR